MLCPRTGPRCFSVFRLPTPGLGNDVSRVVSRCLPPQQLDINGLLRTAHVSQVLTRCPGAFCRIGLYYPAGLQPATPVLHAEHFTTRRQLRPSLQLPVFQGGHPPSTNRARRCLTSMIDREPVPATPQLWLYIYIHVYIYIF